MIRSKGLWRGLSMIFAVVLVLSITTASVMEQYRQPLDENLKTVSSQVVVDSDDGEWTYESNYKTAKEAVDGMRDFAIREATETFVLLKNKAVSDTTAALSLPIKADAKVTLMGMRSYAPVYGSKGGSIPDKNVIDAGNRIYEAFAKEGLKLNPSMLAAYEKFFSDKTWGGSGYGATPPDYRGITDDFDNPQELTLSELQSQNANFRSQYAEYGDAAIVVFGRPGGEGQNALPGAAGLDAEDGVQTTTGNILSLSNEEKEILNEAIDNFENVIVLVNSVTQMDIAELEENDGVDSVLWIGGPGSYGFYAVAQVLNGTVSPSGHLGDIYAKNNAVVPAMVNFGNIPWANVADFASGNNINSYLIQSEGIYTGYRYYETRYADIVTGSGSTDASFAAAGTYTNEDGTPATADGVWDYSNEVVYPFGYGLSYTTFSQTLGTITFSSDMKTAYVPVTVTNTGSVPGKSVIQVYAQSPYTDYDILNGVEKSAIQLMDFEKTETLNAGASATITLNVDMTNLASYDAKKAGTYIMDISEDYFFAIGDDAHDALNNVLSLRGYTTADGMDYNGDSDKAFKFAWNRNANVDGVDATTFSVSKNGTKIENVLSDGIYSMDYNTFAEDTVTYLTRNDWNGTYPQKYEGLTITAEMASLMLNDFIPLASGEASDVVFGDTSVDLMFNDMKGAEFDDPRWKELISKIPVSEILNFMQNAFHNIEEIPSIGFNGYGADDGPGGADSNAFGQTTGAYRGELYEDRMDYVGYGTRIAPAPINLAYSFNKELAYENGEIVLGESTLMYNLPIIIGPAMNLHRHAYNGRGVEYYSEDPILSGFIGSAVVQGAQSKGCLVNIKHAAFNDQEINRSGVAVFMSEQKAREMELRNLQQAFEGNGRPASFATPEGETGNSYGEEGALGVMTSYNRIGAVASSANKAVQVDIMREEWGFKGYNVTDFTGVSMRAAPKESILAGTTAFCGMGAPSVSYWNVEAMSGDADMRQAMRDSMHYALYALSRSYAMDLNVNTHTVSLMTWWRAMYISLITVSAVLTAAAVAGYVVIGIKGRKEKEVK